ncbi:MAG: hypothetical protein A2X25_15260 [Chloroflexi bacterium GWB2_49_20]|nr:MAG: hypothetical protein A2X25_15260 [Chloroflexi bacterium GWB2_49_20]OGN78301.1 MAG: hypothetical protein A2X26_06240 [Chloroflexi bacterium GWC2_49_37]OGN83076.1 MAG: hypothetical protein A2X27_03220 [Chloroflexi bacterium GWD2_49_16]
MTISSKDYFSWYNNEIFRYRDIEWRIAGYSISISYLTALFASQPSTSVLVSNRWFPILFVSFIWLGLFLSEIHVHTRLNEYRAKREALLDDEANDKYRKVTGNLFGGGTRDLLFLLGFILIPLIIAISSAITIFNSN